jgi:hypothetical protein
MENVTAKPTREVSTIDLVDKRMTPVPVLNRMPMKSHLEAEPTVEDPKVSPGCREPVKMPVHLFDKLVRGTKCPDGREASHGRGEVLEDIGGRFCIAAFHC